MSSTGATIHLDRTRSQPGDLLAGTFTFPGQPPERYTVELSVLWRTEGKGDGDLGIILFREWSWEKTRFDFRQPQDFEVRLPRSPLTYDGVLVKIGWLVRVRLRWVPECEAVAEEPFQLGPGRAAISRPGEEKVSS
jgi:hypothetical protein